MSETDSFIEEVTEEVRRDRLYKYVRKYGWIAVVAVLGVVGTTGFLEWQKHRAAQNAQILGDKLVSALNENDAKARAVALEKLTSVAGGATVIVEFNRAAELIEAGDKDGALNVLDGLAQGQTDPVYSDMAKLKAIMLRGETLGEAKRNAVLEELAAPGRPFRPLAVEQQGLSALQAGNKEKALELFKGIFQDSETTEGLRSRSTQMIIALGGELPESSQLLSE